MKQLFLFFSLFISTQDVFSGETPDKPDGIDNPFGKKPILASDSDEKKVQYIFKEYKKVADFTKDQAIRLDYLKSLSAFLWANDVPREDKISLLTPIYPVEFEDFRENNISLADPATEQPLKDYFILQASSVFERIYLARNYLNILSNHILTLMETHRKKYPVSPDYHLLVADSGFKELSNAINMFKKEAHYALVSIAKIREEIERCSPIRDFTNSHIHQEAGTLQCELSLFTDFYAASFDELRAPVMETLVRNSIATGSEKDSHRTAQLAASLVMSLPTLNPKALGKLIDCTGEKDPSKVIAVTKSIEKGCGLISMVHKLHSSFTLHESVQVMQGYMPALSSYILSKGPTLEISMISKIDTKVAKTYNKFVKAQESEIANRVREDFLTPEIRAALQKKAPARKKKVSKDKILTFVISPKDSSVKIKGHKGRKKPIEMTLNTSPFNESEKEFLENIIFGSDSKWGTYSWNAIEGLLKKAGWAINNGTGASVHFTPRSGLQDLLGSFQISIHRDHTPHKHPVAAYCVRFLKMAFREAYGMEQIFIKKS